MSRLRRRRDTSTRASRKLRGNDRIARHARNIVWKRVIAFLKRDWLLLALFLILPTALMLLTPFKTSGTERWILVGVMGKGDIDHILIGPAGLLVFESKNVIGDIPIYLICVLWSREQSTDDDRYFFRESVYGIRGSELANWLAGLPKNIVSESVIKAVAAPIESFAHLRDQDDVLSDGPFRPTLDKLRVGSLVLPRVGIFIPAFVLAYVAILDQDTPIIVAMGILLLLGLLIRVILKMKALAYVNHWVTR